MNAPIATENTTMLPNPGGAPSESPSWVTVPPCGRAEPVAEPEEQWGTWVELQGGAAGGTFLGLGTLPTDGATQGAYGRFHAFTWRPRLRWVLLALSLLSIAELASELSTQGTADAPFSARLRSQHPTAGRAGLVLALLLRCSALGVTAASTFTRWPPLRSLLTRCCAPTVPPGAIPLLCPYGACSPRARHPLKLYRRCPSSSPSSCP